MKRPHLNLAHGIFHLERTCPQLQPNQKTNLWSENGIQTNMEDIRGCLKWILRNSCFENPSTFTFADSENKSPKKPSFFLPKASPKTCQSWPSWPPPPPPQCYHPTSLAWPWTHPPPVFPCGRMQPGPQRVRVGDGKKLKTLTFRLMFGEFFGLLIRQSWNLNVMIAHTPRKPWKEGEFLMTSNLSKGVESRLSKHMIEREQLQPETGPPFELKYP